jgi:hypothetical protein
MNATIIGTLLDPSLPPKTNRYPADWARTLIRQTGRRPANIRCYGNCFRLCGDPALGRPFHYVEGWVWDRALPAAVRHAWLEDSNGRVLDPTPNWRECEGATYLGAIALTATELLAAIDAKQSPPSLTGGLDFWDDTFLGRHMGTGQRHAIWRTTGLSLDEQQGERRSSDCSSAQEAAGGGDRHGLVGEAGVIDMMEDDSIGHTPEELADIARCEEVARQRAELAAAFPPDAKRIYWSDDTLPDETRTHSIWRFMRDRGQAVDPTFPAYLRRMFYSGEPEPDFTWSQFLKGLYDYALKKGYAGDWDAFLREAGERDDDAVDR